MQQDCRLIISLDIKSASLYRVHMGVRREARPKRFLPFMEGPRSCAGQALAAMNMTATLALLYGSFSFRLADEARSSPPYSAKKHKS